MFQSCLLGNFLTAFTFLQHLLFTTPITGLLAFTYLVTLKAGYACRAGDGCSGGSPLPLRVTDSSILSFSEGDISGKCTKHWGFFLL